MSSPARCGYVFLLVLPWIQLVRATNFGEPPQIHSSGGIETARAGDNVKLPCDVDDVDAFVTWSKDGESINVAWPRFKVLASFLRIKGAVEEDSGHYICIATNGFGSAEVAYTLYVSGNNSDAVVVPSDHTMRPHLTANRAPVFDKPHSMESEKLEPMGSTVRLKCHASGAPEPQITWFKDDRRIQEPLYVSSRDRPADKWTLVLSDVTSADEGTYTCDVMNDIGSIRHEYRLTVIETLNPDSKPIIHDPVNTTVTYGQMATFQCKVNSQVPPTIQWLKRVDSSGDLMHNNKTIVFEKQEYIVLQTHVSVNKENGLYMSKLNIQSATTEHAGKYMCLGTNGLGYSLKDAYLTVLPAPAKDTYDQSESLMEDNMLLVLIALPALLVLVLAAVVIYCLCKKRAQYAQTPPKAAAQTTLASPKRAKNGGHGAKSPPPPLADSRLYEHQYTALQGPAGVVGNHYVPPPSNGYNTGVLPGHIAPHNSYTGGFQNPHESPYSGLLAHENGYSGMIDYGNGAGGQVYLKNYGGLQQPQTHTQSEVSSSGGHRSVTPPTSYMHASAPPPQQPHYQNCVT